MIIAGSSAGTATTTTNNINNIVGDAIDSHQSANKSTDKPYITTQQQSLAAKWTTLEQTHPTVYVSDTRTNAADSTAHTATEYGTNSFYRVSERRACGDPHTK
eukprot:gene21458-27492_t